ncbi:serine hydrolase domain-containing protein [Nocardia sp. NPDC052566]|uniref:serine hydrolase domain-containing protein n=1 Tax=Nocardia sp. NPDC052566 TaxID=3364330 RepID=UPI0037C5463B
MILRYAVAAATAFALAATATPAAAAPLDAAAAIMAEGFEEGVAAGYPGVIGLVRTGDDVRYVRAGVGDLATGVPADPAARFRIGSVTKAFVVTVLLQLAGEGRLSLDDSVERWLPGVVRGNGIAGELISIRQLLNHSSGLPEFLDDQWVSAQYVADLDPYRMWSPRTLVDIAMARPPYAAPGSGFHYANTNYVVAGMVIEAVTGGDPVAEIQRRIIEPLGLRHTAFATDPVPQGNWLRGYFLTRDVSISDPTAHGMAAGMVSTLDDLADFARAQQAGLLAAGQLAELRATVETGRPDTDYGLGIARLRTDCGPMWAHIGSVLGYFTLVATDASGQRQIVIAGNEYHMIAASGPQVLLRTAQRAFCEFIR